MPTILHIMKSAVGVLIERDGLFLAASRRGDSSLWGFPGGKLDPFESNVEAVVRELGEETGLLCSTMNLLPLFSAICRGEVDFWVTMYLWQDTRVEDTELKAEDGLILDWKTREFLCSEEHSPFAVYNRKAFAAYDEFKRG